MNILSIAPEAMPEFVDYPLTLAQLKQHLGITTSSEDSRLQNLIKAAYYFCEKTTNRSFLKQEWELHLPHFNSCIKLPKSPVIEINSIKYLNDAGGETTLDPATYFVYKPTYSPTFIEPVSYFPVSNWTRKDAVRINYTVGYSTQPPELLAAMQMLCGSFNENREAELVGTISKELEIGAGRLLGLLCVGSY